MIPALPEITYSPLSSLFTFKAKTEGRNVIVKNSVDHILRTDAEVIGSNLILHISESNNKEFEELLLVTIEYLLGHMPEIKNIHIQGYDLPAYPFHLFPGNKLSREQFFQIPTLWHHKAKFDLTPETWTETNGRQHPKRSAPYQGVVYKRFVPEINKTISFRLVELEQDLDIFHEWHNQPRVFCFWELNKPKEELREYLVKGLADAHQFPMIVEFDNEPVGYYEMYWVVEDRLGPYYESEAWDRGFHFLIGNTKFLGYANTDTIIKSGVHFLFLDDPRTRKIMAEPRHDNHKVLRYAEASKGWRKVKEFDFPHKRAALLECKREGFFGGNAL